MAAFFASPSRPFRIVARWQLAATAMLTEIWEQHCLVPDVAKKAAKALKLLTDEKLKSLTSAGSNQKKIVSGRIELVRDQVV